LGGKTRIVLVGLVTRQIFGALCDVNEHFFSICIELLACLLYQPLNTKGLKKSVLLLANGNSVLAEISRKRRRLSENLVMVSWCKHIHSLHQLCVHVLPTQSFQQHYIFGG
jgi:hypothetical protein